MRGIWRVHILGLSLLVLAPAQSAIADAAANLKQADGLYRNGQHAQAEQAYQHILKSEADDPEAVYQAARMLPRVYLATDRPSQAQAAVEQLLTKSAQHERLPHALHEIVEQAKALDKTVEAGQIYQNILDTRPSHPQEVWLKMGIAIANAHLGNHEATEAALQNIIAQHASDEGAAEAFGQTAWAYRKLKDHERARAVYQYVVDNWPNKDRAIFSQRGIVLCSLAVADQETADVATQELLQKFAGDKNMSEVLWNIAKIYRAQKDWGRTRLLCQYILNNTPESKDAIWAQQALIYAAIDEEDAVGVNSGIQTLHAKYSSEDSMPAAAYGIARKLNGKMDNKAAELYQYMIDEHPEHQYIAFAKVNLGQIKLRQGDSAAAEATFQRVLADYASHPRLAETVHLMAEGYHDQAFRKRFEESTPKHGWSDSGRAYLDGAISKWRLITEQLPGHPYVTPAAYYHLASSYYQLRDYQKAEECCTTLVTRWPANERAWQAQYLIAKMYKLMMRDDTLSKTETESRMKSAYEQLVEQYPSCPVAPAIRKWLEAHEAGDQGGEK